MASPQGQEDEVQLPREDQEGPENLMPEEDLVPGGNQEVAEDLSSLSSFLDDTRPDDDDSDLSTNDRPFAGKRSQDSDEASFYGDLSLESFDESDLDSPFQYIPAYISSEEELSDDDWSTVELSSDEESTRPAEEEPTSLEATYSNSSILDLPPEVLQKILGYLSFHEVKLLTISGDLMAQGPFLSATAS